jgi:hypothetical protein
LRGGAYAALSRDGRTSELHTPLASATRFSLLLSPPLLLRRSYILNFKNENNGNVKAKVAHRLLVGPLKESPAGNHG